MYEAFPNDFGFRERFLAIARKYKNAESLVETIAESIIKEFSFLDKVFPLFLIQSLFNKPPMQALFVYADVKARKYGKLSEHSYMEACSVFETTIRVFNLALLRHF